MNVMTAPAELPQLVRTHLPFVYACALRQTRGNVHLAEDVTHAVFIILAKKFSRLKSDAVLRDWLFITTRFAAKNAMKMEARRKYHERQAAFERSEIARDRSELLNPLSPLLDDALAALNSADRAGVMLSFFDNKTFREVGLSLGVSEEAARKRTARAIDKLRAFFVKRGVRAGQDDVERSLQAQSPTPAPAPALISSVINSALLAASNGAAPASTLAIIKGVNHMLAMAKLKFATLCIAACVIAGGAGATIVASAWASEKPPTTSPPTTSPAKPHAAKDVGAASFDDGVIVEVAGVSKLSDDATWWRADGSPTERPCDPSTSQDNPAMSMAILLRVVGVPDTAGIEWIMPPNSWSSQPATKDGAPIENAQIMTSNPNQPTIDLSCHVATGEWQTLAETEGADNARCGSDDNGSYAIAPAGEHDGKAMVSVSYNVPDHQVRVIAVDSHGVEHTGRCIFSGGTKSFAMVTIEFDFPPADLAKVVLQKRPYDHTVQIKNITMDPAKKTQVEVTAEKR